MVLPPDRRLPSDESPLCWRDWVGGDHGGAEQDTHRGKSTKGVVERGSGWCWGVLGGVVAAVVVCVGGWLCDDGQKSYWTDCVHHHS